MHKSFRRYEIGCLDIYALPCTGYCLLEHQRHVEPLGGRAACNQLHPHRMPFDCRGQRPFLQKRLPHEIPVDGKRLLEGENRRPLHTQVKVAPNIKQLTSVNIAVGHVHPPDITNFPVDYHDFTVVTPVDACTERREHYFEKRICLDPGLFQPPQITVRKLKRTNMVVNKPHFDPGTRTLHQRLHHPDADIVVHDYVVLHVDIAPGCGYISQ